MTPGAILAMKELIKAKLTKYDMVMVSSQRVQDSTKKSYTAPDPRRSGKTMIIRGGYMKMPSKEFVAAVGRLDAKEFAAYKDNDYKAPTMRSNIKKGRRK